MEEIKNITDLTQEQIDANFAAVVGRGSLEEISFYADFVKDANIPDRFKINPLRLALANPSNSEEKYKIMKAVLGKQPNVNVKDTNGLVPAMEAFEKNHRGIGLLLIGAAGADLSVVDNDGDGLLNYAARTGSANVVYKALKMRVPYGVNKKGEGALSIAVQDNNMPVIEAIIQGIWENRKNPRHLSDFKAAWNVARENGNEEVLHALVRTKQAENSLDLSTARDRAIGGQIKYVQTEAEFKARYERLPKEDQILVEKLVPATVFGGSISERLSRSLFSQVDMGTAHDVAVLLALGANPNAQDRYGQTPLLVAIGSSLKGKDAGDYDIILPESAPYDKAECLIRYGADVWKETNRQAPFIWAFTNNRPGIAALLLSALPPEKRSEMARKKNEVGDGPLKDAAEYCGPGGIKLVLQNGGDINETGSQGKRVMYWAVNGGKPDNIMALWKSGFELDLKSDEGREILALLEERRHKWDMPHRYDENGEIITMSEGEKESVRSGIYENVLKALHKEYVSEYSNEKQVKKSKKTVDINLPLKEKLAALNLEEAAKLDGLMGMTLLPNRKKSKDRSKNTMEIQQEAGLKKPVPKEGLIKKMLRHRKEVRAQKAAQKAAKKQRELIKTGGR